MVKIIGFGKCSLYPLFFVLLLTLFVSGCMRSDDMICNYDGICDDDETDNCPDCANVLGRGVPYPVDDESDYDVDLKV